MINHPKIILTFGTRDSSSQLFSDQQCVSQHKGTGDIDGMFHVLTISSIVGRAEKPRNGDSKRFRKGKECKDLCVESVACLLPCFRPQKLPRLLNSCKQQDII